MLVSSEKIDKLLYLEQDYQFSKFLMGISVCCMNVGCCIVFWYSEKIIGFLTIPVSLLIPMYVFSIRMLLYAIEVSNTVRRILIILEPVHGITFALMWATTVHYVGKIAPKNKKATGTAIVSGIHNYNIGAGSNRSRSHEQ